MFARAAFALLAASGCAAPARDDDAPCAEGWVRVAEGHCARAEDTGADDSGDTPDTSTDTSTDTSDTSEAGALPWDDDAFWTDPGPLAALVASRPEPARYAVRLATSADGRTFVDAGTAAWGLSSLHVLVAGDGLVVTGMVDAGIVLLEERTVYALVTRDLATWGSVAWPVGGAVEAMTVDAAPYLAEDGRLGVVYFSTSVEGVDPASIPGAHPIRRAWWEDGALVEAAEPLLAEEGLVDPCVCTLDGVEVLFATAGEAGVLVAPGTDDGFGPVATGSTLSGVTVPFCRVDGDVGTLLAQVPGSDAPPRAFTFDATGRVEAAGDAAVENPFDGQCTSPAIVPWRDGWLMVCAVPL